LMLFFVQSACVLSDYRTYFVQGSGTSGIPLTLVGITANGAYPTNNPVHLAFHCQGVQAAGDPIVLIEAGGGSGMSGYVDLASVLVKNNLRACIYDRPGYGYSQTGLPYHDLATSAATTYEALASLGETGPYICAGHSAGGNMCRNFAAEFPANVSGISLLDAYCNRGDCNIEIQYDLDQGKPSQYPRTYGIRVTLTDALRFFTPFALVRAFLSKSGFPGSNYGGNGCWNQQFLEFRPAPNDTIDHTLDVQYWWTPNILAGIPLHIHTAGVTANCTAVGKTDEEDCNNYIRQQNSTKNQVLKYLTTSSNSVWEDCEFCDHGFTDRYPDIAASGILKIVEAVRTNSSLI
jgi:pimeloyl-ACP methyl ester carboxylesterase